MRTHTARERLIVAADLSSREEILALCEEVGDAVGTIKIGLQAFIANGPSIVREIVERGQRVFLDLKIHDIPNTASRAVEEAAHLGASMVTVHATGGREMLRAAAAATSNGMLVLGVTILTSFDDIEVQRIGMRGSSAENAIRLASLAREAGIGGIVSSPLEIRAIRQVCGEAMKIVTPGIRAAGSETGDQKRTMPAAEAIREGADYIVVGRPVTAARDRRAAALQIVEEIERA